MLVTAQLVCSAGVLIALIAGVVLKRLATSIDDTEDETADSAEPESDFFDNQ